MNPTDFNLTELQLPFPASLPAAFWEDDLPANETWFFCYWTPAGDEFRVGTATIETDGAWHAWQAYHMHPAVYGHLAAYNLGSSDSDAEHRLVFSLETHQVYVGTVRDVRRFFAALRPVTQESLQTLTAEGWRALMDSLSAAARTFHQEMNQRDPKEIMAEVQARMEREDHLIEQMVAELNMLPRICYLCHQVIDPADVSAYLVALHIDGCPEEVRNNESHG